MFCLALALWECLMRVPYESDLWECLMRVPHESDLLDTTAITGWSSNAPLWNCRYDNRPQVIFQVIQLKLEIPCRAAVYTVSSRWKKKKKRQIVTLLWWGSCIFKERDWHFRASAGQITNSAVIRVENMISFHADGGSIVSGFDGEQENVAWREEGRNQ